MFFLDPVRFMIRFFSRLYMVYMEYVFNIFLI